MLKRVTGAFVDILNRHLRIKELIELSIALLVMPDGSFSQISLPTELQILVAALLKGYRLRCHFQLFHCKILLELNIKYWTHHLRFMRK